MTAQPSVAEAQVPDPRALFEDVLPRYLAEHGSGALPDGVVVVFHLEGAGGGSWQVRRKGGVASVGPVSARTKDCVVRCDAGVFMDIVAGRLDYRDAFLAGRLRMTGDVGLAIRLQTALRDAA